MNLHDLLQRRNIDPQNVLVLRHAPGKKLPKLKKALPSLAENRPDVFNAYQQSQNHPVEGEMADAKCKYVAAFIGHEGKKALFAGLYLLQGFKRITVQEFWGIPANAELRDEYGMEMSRSSMLWFDLRLTDFYAHLKGKLVIGWPPKELNWHHWADEWAKKMPILLPDESELDTTMPSSESERAVIESTEKKPFVDQVQRLRVERAAINAAARHYGERGYDVISVERERVGYDLEARCKSNTLLIEVKGTNHRTDHATVNLSPNEYKKSKSCKQQYRICVVTEALSVPRVNDFSWDPQGEVWRDESTGKSLAINEVVSADITIV